MEGGHCPPGALFGSHSSGSMDPQEEYAPQAQCQELTHKFSSETSNQNIFRQTQCHTPIIQMNTDVVGQ